MKKNLSTNELTSGLIIYLKDSQKLKLLPEIIAGLGGNPCRDLEVKRIVRGFLQFLKASGLTRFLPQVLRDLKKQLPKKVEVFTSSQLSPASKDQILDFLNETFGPNLETNFEIEKEILGGAVIKIDDNILDASARGQLNSLAEDILEGN